MPVKRKYYLWLLLATGFSHYLFGQATGSEQIPLKSSTDSTSVNAPATDSLFTIQKIIIQGNKKTKRNIMLREIPFKTGDRFSLSDIVKKFEEARKNLMNTTLFHEVVVASK